MALSEIKKEPSLQGRGLAVASLAIGYTLVGITALGVLGTVLYFVIRLIIAYLQYQHSSGLILPLIW